VSFETPGDDIRCDHCNQPGKPYTYKDIQFSGLCPTEDGKLCRGCRDAYLDRKTPRPEDVPVAVIAAQYRYSDYQPRGRRSRR
jgi:hypothetical protein